jgi:tryptophanyl-tRNA synthetase
MKPIHERQDYYVNHKDEVENIIAEGTSKATSIARLTMDEVREAVKI